MHAASAFYLLLGTRQLAAQAQANYQQAYQSIRTMHTDHSATEAANLSRYSSWNILLDTRLGDIAVLLFQFQPIEQYQTKELTGLRVGRL